MRGRILIVDDEPDVIKLLTRRLESNDYGVITAFGGKEALHKARTERPGLIILDAMMPVMDGYKVCAVLKQDKELCHIPVIILTAMVRYEEKEIADKCGADGFVSKYYMSDILLTEIERLLNK